MDFLFGFKPAFSQIFCCFDLTKKVTTFCRTNTDVALGVVDVMLFQLSLSSLFFDNLSRQLVKMFPFSRAKFLDYEETQKMEQNPHE